MASPAPRKPERRVLVAALSLLLATTVAAQAAPIAFTTGDGSRFVLVADASVRQVHWVVATLADGSDDPPGLEGLTMATMRASLGGTWRTGCNDPTAERAALVALGEAWQVKIGRPTDAAAAATVLELTAKAEALGDTITFPRVLASLPVHRPEVGQHGPIATLTLTTLAAAIPDVAARLVERREQQALRDLPRAWMRELLGRADRHFGDPDNSVRTEVLALAMPNAAELRQREQPRMQAPGHEQALAVWAATQHPTRSVHLLYGDFDAAAARPALEAAFARTALPTPAPLPAAAPRPIRVSRTSIVPGTGKPKLALAWVLPPIPDPFVLTAATAWLAGGTDSVVARALAKAGRRDCVVQVTAPWPATIDGRSLLLIEVDAPNGTDGLAAAIVRTCADAVREAPADKELQAANGVLQQRWRTLGDDPRAIATAMARAALLWPGSPVTARWPARIDGKAAQALLQLVFTDQPVIVSRP
ncbi:MAG: hypothetical protein IT455_16260 [Planctomycetes bacterium]|nr:hypothetical protein [Planctomycetota bacterium]